MASGAQETLQITENDLILQFWAYNSSDSLFNTVLKKEMIVRYMKSKIRC